MVPAQSPQDFVPEIALLYCRQALSAEERPLEGLQDGPGCKVRFTLLPCSSKIDTAHLLRVLGAGADGVQVVGCPAKACRFLVGSDRAERRMTYAQKLLDEIGVGSGRLGIVRKNGLDVAALMDLAAQRAEAVRALGPNPTKGV